MRRRFSKTALQCVLLLACAWIACAQGSATYNTKVPSSILDQFRNLRPNWIANVWVYANSLFGLLALIEFAWSAAVMLLEKSDFQSWTAALVRKMMWLGAFYALLLFGNSWIPAIIDSFTAIGQSASGVAALSPGAVFAQGLQIAGALMGGASGSAFLTNPGTSLALVLCALLIVISYIVITINFVVTIVESYILVSVGFIFLGFGGSRWTAPYVERFIGLAVAIGVKILLLYCLISGGMNLGLGWIDEAQSISGATRPLMTAFDVMGAAVIFMMLCWHIPKLFAGVLGGSPALTGGDFAATVGAIATAAVAGASTMGSGAGAVVGSGVLASKGVGASSAGGSGAPSSAASAVGGVGAAKAASLAPPAAVASSAASGSASARSQPGPPSKPAATATTALSSVGGQPLAGSGFEAERPAAGFQRTTVPIDTDDSSSSAQQNLFEDATTGSGGTVGAGNAIGSGNSTTVAAPKPMGIASTVQRVGAGISRTVRRIQGIRYRIPSDAAPSAAPPRMPIDHEE